MKQEKPMCWCCVWRDITGPDNDPTLGCGHTSAQIRRRFEGSSTAEYLSLIHISEPTRPY